MIGLRGTVPPQRPSSTTETSSTSSTTSRADSWIEYTLEARKQSASRARALFVSQRAAFSGRRGSQTDDLPCGAGFVLSLISMRWPRSDLPFARRTSRSASTTSRSKSPAESASATSDNSTEAVADESIIRNGYQCRVRFGKMWVVRWAIAPAKRRIKI